MIEIDNTKQNIFTVKSDCGQCKYFEPDFTCPAFPNGIPDKLLQGKQKHRKRLPGQTGEVVFESILKDENK